MTLRDPSKERAIKRGERKERKKRFGSGGICPLSPILSLITVVKIGVLFLPRKERRTTTLFQDSKWHLQQIGELRVVF